MTSSFVIAGGNDNHFLERALSSTLNENKEELSFSETLSRYGVSLIMQATSENEVDDLKSELPTDTHVVTYTIPGLETACDAVRAYTMADIFDAYHDLGATVSSITNGYGSVKPKLWSDARKDSK